MTSKKSDTFATTPMNDKDVTELGGVGRVTAGAMRKKGINKAYQVVGKFLYLEKKEDEFKDWLQEFGTDARQRSDCYDSVKGWCDQFT